MYRRNPRPLTLILTLAGLLALFAGGLAIHGAAAAQTIPTRTPTPVGGQATATSGSGGPGPNPTTPPTSTSRAQQATATSTPFAILPTPVGGFLPTARPCDIDVTVRALASGINVRSGPGLAYEVVGNMLRQEVRPVIGRAAHAAWWQIVLADTDTGWVSNDLVEINGYTGLVPVVEAPPIDEVTVTPGTPWAPTPQPNCTPPPTSSPTATPSATVRATVAAPGSAVVDGENGVLALATETAAATVTARPTMNLATPETTPTVPPPTAVPLPGESEESGGISALWAPIAGLGLILAAAAIFLARRLRA